MPQGYQQIGMDPCMIIIRIPVVGMDPVAIGRDILPGPITEPLDHGLGQMPAQIDPRHL